MKKQKEDIDKQMIDAMLERPITFTLKDKYFYIYPPSIGIVFLCGEIIKRLKFDKKLFILGQQFELLRICTESREDVLRIVAIHTFSDASDARYEEKILARIEELSTLDAAELSTLLIAVLQWNLYQEKFVKHIGLDKEKKQRERVQEAKQDNSTITFGGRSLYGSLIDLAAERYGWSLQYIMWGVSAINLHMMLQDSVQTVYLSEKDRKKARVSTDGVVLKADDKNNKAAIRQLFQQNKKK